MTSQKSEVRSQKLTNKKNKIIFLVGPTAVGKSKIAVSLAKKINAEIISCDSMQLYKGMDIITSKPSLTLRKKVRHHLMSVILPTREYNVSRYYKDALKKIKEIFNRGKIPLFVGGSGLYMSVLADGIFRAKAQNRSVRSRLYAEAEKFGSNKLYVRLKKIDPLAAQKIHPHDTRRIVRALEVFASTGKPISQWQRQRRGLDAEYGIKTFCLNMRRDGLYQKIEGRVERMFGQGLVQEARKLLKLKLSRTASYAIGLRELKGYFDGSYDLDEARRLISRNTRQYAKRQLTWFRKDKRIEWMEVDDKETPVSVANKIFEKLELVHSS